MSFNGAETKDQLNFSLNSALMLNSACQGIIETYVQPSDSPWYAQIKVDLSEAQTLVREWRTQGYLYFNQDILACAIKCGQQFVDSRDRILTLFDEMAANLNDETKAELIWSLEQLKRPVRNMSTSVGKYEDNLRSWGDKMQSAQDTMAKTIAKIQAQESDLQADIAAINTNIVLLQDQIVEDRRAIAMARKEKEEGIVETIIGIVLAPVTGGGTLILAGIGVSSIAEAEGEIEALKSLIKSYQDKITNLQHQMTEDQKEISALQGIVLSTGIALSDIELIDTALDPLKASWDSFDNSLGDVVAKITNAENAEVVVVAKGWFNAVCNEWIVLLPDTVDLYKSKVITHSIRCG